MVSYFGPPNRNTISSLLHRMHTTCSAHVILLYLNTLTIFCEEDRLSSSLISFSQDPSSSLEDPKILSNTPSLKTSVYVAPLHRETKFRTRTEQLVKLWLFIFQSSSLLYEKGRQKILD